MAPPGARKQAAIPVVGFLHSGIEEQATQLMGFKKGLKKAGLKTGVTFHFNIVLPKDTMIDCLHWLLNL